MVAAGLSVSTPEAYSLLHEGVIALADVERSGIRIDVPYLDRTIDKLGRYCDRLERELKQQPLYAVWRKRYGDRANITSPEQMGVIVFEELGYESKGHTATGKYKADLAAFEGVQDEFIRTALRIKRLRHASSTFLAGIRRETVDGYLHPFFNLHTARTYRSSSSEPNSQNWPIRDKELGRTIRRAFIPSDFDGEPGVILEIDYGQIEVRISACYHHDPNLINYILDKSTDMHRDMAAQCYKLPVEQVEAAKGSRAAAKGSFVFASFYGSYYAQTAKGLWDAIYRDEIKGPDGALLYEHLKRQGIRELGDCDPQQKPRAGTFERHIKEVEDDFWGRRFRVYAEWRRSFYRDYLQRGWFDTLTGFHIEGIYSRNDVSNYPIQGSAFHCLLWSLIQLNRWLKKHKFRSRIICQIHDSILLDVKQSELQDVLAAAHRIMTQEVRRHWPWIITPLEIDAAAAPPGASWFHKEKVKIPA